jgi:hypothetical protein
MLTPLALALVASLAHAADGPASNVFPRATLPTARRVGVEAWGMATLGTECVYAQPSPDGTSSFDGGCRDTFDPIGGPALRVDLPVGDRAALDLRGGWVGGDGEGVPVATAFLRVRAYESGAVTLTPWVGGGKLLPIADESTDSVGLWAAGLAVDAGGEKVRVDLSAPVVALLEVDFESEFIPVGIPTLFSEAGVRFEVAKGHAVRVGTASLAPGVSWQGRFEQATVEVALHGFSQAGFARASVSRTF